MDTILKDIRYAARRIRRAPGLSIVIILTLALGIGANTAIFSVVDALLLRPLPYPEPGELVTIEHHYPSLDGLQAPVSAQGFERYRDQTRSFEAVAVQTGWQPSLTGEGDAQRVTGSQVSAQWFDVYDVQPALGRSFSPDEDQPGGNFVVVLSDGFWRRQFGADPAVVGRSITLNGEAHEIVGVMPRDFRPFYQKGAELWRPLGLSAELYATDREWLALSARLRPGTSVESAAAEMTAFAERIHQDDPSAYPPDWSLVVTTLNEKAKGDLRPALLVLLGAVGFVLLIACANVASLLLSRAMARRKEIAIRSALGAQGWDVLRQLLMESVLLALIGGALGLLVAVWGVAALTELGADSLQGVDQVRISGTVLAFTLGISLAAGLLFGVVPALQSTRLDVQTTLREGGRSDSADRAGGLLRRGLVVSEIALALTLLTGAGLLIRSFAQIQGVDPGFNPSGVLSFELALPLNQYDSYDARMAFFDRAFEELGALPGVTAVGGTSVLPFSGGWSTGSFSVEGLVLDPGAPEPWGDFRIVSPGYAEAMEIQVTRGRFFTEQDRADSPPVAVVDEELARRYWPDEDPIGKRIAEDEEWITVVGVVAHTKQEGLDAEDRVQLYLPYKQTDVGSLDVVARTTGDPLAMTAAVRRTVQAIDPDLPIANVERLEDLVNESLGQRRLSMFLLSLFAGLALLLAALGVYGIMSYLVAQRTRELGLRMAMGAERTDVLRLVLRQGMTLAAVGVGIGLVGSLALTRLIASQLYAVNPSDPVTFATVAVLLAAIAFTATFLPARRATGIDPMSALRSD